MSPLMSQRSVSTCGCLVPLLVIAKLYYLFSKLTAARQSPKLHLGACPYGLTVPNISLNFERAIYASFKIQLFPHSIILQVK